LTARPVGGAAGQLGRKVFWDARWRQVRDAVVVVAFEDYVFEAAAQGLRNVAPDERADVYVVSFFVYDEADDPRAPTLTVGTNTETQVQLASDPPADFQKPNPWWTPARSEEARWNYAFWRQTGSHRSPTPDSIRSALPFASDGFVTSASRSRNP
jgi:hypothetical protein